MTTECFDKRMALDVIEDALTGIDTPHGSGVAVGLCGGLYMCGLLSEAEWEAVLKRIPVELCEDLINETRKFRNLKKKGCRRFIH